MAIFGSVTLEDITINFTVDADDMCHYVIHDSFSKEVEHCQAPGRTFMNALSIAVHWDGTPNYEVDYPEAEEIQGAIRWIP